MPRPKKTLFGFTRKRIFDTLLTRYKRFDVLSLGDWLPSKTIRFRYGGAMNLNIEICEMPGPQGILFITYRSGKAGANEHRVAETMANRWQVNDRLAELFQKREVVNHG